METNNDYRAELRKGLRCLLKGIILIAYAIGSSFNRAAHSYPYVLLTIFAVPCLIASMVCIGKARAERDSINKTNYELSIKVDSLQNLVDVKTKTYAY